MTEPAHYPRGPSGAHRWLLCTDSPAAEEGYPDSTSDAADEGTAAHWLLEQCLNAGLDAQDWVEQTTDPIGTDGAKVVPAGKETGAVKPWPITGEMIESVQIHIDTFKPDLEKKGTRAFFEERVRIDHALGLNVPIGGTADTIIYLPRSKTLKVGDFKYGKGHVVEVKGQGGTVYERDEVTGKWNEVKAPDWGINPQLGMYALGALVELERLLGEKREVKTIELIVVQPRAYHKKGAVRKVKLAPADLMKLEFAIVNAVTGPQVRVPGDHCHFCKAKLDCEARAEALGAKATADFEGEANPLAENDTAPESKAVVPAESANLVTVLGHPAKGLSLNDLGNVRKLLPAIKEWIKEVEAEIAVRLKHEYKVPGVRLGIGRGSRAYGGNEDDLRIAAARTAQELGVEFSALHEPAVLKSPAKLEKEFGEKKFKTTTLSTLVTKTEGGPVVVDEDSDTPDWVPHSGFGEAEQAPTVPDEPKPDVAGSHLL